MRSCITSHLGCPRFLTLCMCTFSEDQTFVGEYFECMFLRVPPMCSGVLTLCVSHFRFIFVCFLCVPFHIAYIEKISLEVFLLVCVVLSYFVRLTQRIVFECHVPLHVLLCFIILLVCLIPWSLAVEEYSACLSNYVSCIPFRQTVSQVKVLSVLFPVCLFLCSRVTASTWFIL